MSKLTITGLNTPTTTGTSSGQNLSAAVRRLRAAQQNRMSSAPVILIDASGSMSECASRESAESKMQKAKDALRQVCNKFPSASIVSFGSYVDTLSPNNINRIQPGGMTPMFEAIKQALAITPR